MSAMADHWVENHRRDGWRRQAKAGGYRARSAFKLKQIQSRFEVMREGDVVLDVGCHPGGWTQVAVETVSESGIVVGVDLLATQPVEGATLLTGDVTDPLTQQRLLEVLKGREVNAIVSDISPDISGNWDIDQSVALDLVAMVFDFGLPRLAPGGALVTKLFQGTGVEELIECVRPHFSKVRRFSPDASRNSSSEVYLVCKNHTPWSAPSATLSSRFEASLSQRLDGAEDVVDSTPSGFRVVRRGPGQD
jgi:23S rRNA (uridine2552-2'-O)-methyltransferase